MESDMGARSRRAVSAAVALLAVAALAAIGAGTAGAEVVYNNVPSPLPGNFASIGLAATSSSEFGGEIELAGTARSKPSITVVMSSWACQTGSWNEGNCATPKPMKGFKVPVTVRVYAAGELEEGPIAEVTKNAKMLYRPSESPSMCEPGRWYDATSATCFHGLAFPISVKLGKLKKMPKRTVVTVAYPHSSGPAQSLNVATSEPSEGTLSLGGQPVEEWFVNSTSSEMYCPGAKEVGTLGPEEGTGCQEGINYQPVYAVSAN
jgi:hypothetical protein